MSEMGSASKAVAAMSRMIDAHNASRPRETQTWARLAKITEEAGEVVSAYIGATGQNPRKGVSHTLKDVEQELLDVALTALSAVEHLRDHDEQSFGLLAEKADRTLTRLRSTTH